MANTCLKLMKDRKQEAWGTKIRINVEHTHAHHSQTVEFKR